MAVRPIHKLTVAAKVPLTTHMVRVTFTGPSVAELPADCLGGYMKLMLPRADGVDVSAIDVDAIDRNAFTKRSFTIRELDRQGAAMVLDFVSFGHPGAAAAWLQSAQVGDTALMTGPGPVTPLSHEGDWVFLAADMAALPALAVQLEGLPPDARGVAVVEVLDEGDQQRLAAPAGVQVQWVVNPDAAHSQLEPAVRQQPWQQGRVAMWAACEYSTMKRLRSYFFEERGVDRDDCYISSYWKIGATDEQHKAAKKAEQDA